MTSENSVVVAAACTVPECSLVDCETPVASELTGASSREQKVEYCLLLKDGTGITVQSIIIVPGSPSSLLLLQIGCTGLVDYWTTLT